MHCVCQAGTTRTSRTSYTRILLVNVPAAAYVHAIKFWHHEFMTYMASGYTESRHRETTIMIPLNCSRVLHQRSGSCTYCTLDWDSYIVHRTSHIAFLYVAHQTHPLWCIHIEHMGSLYAHMSCIRCKSCMAILV